jgi:hypothetical protein
VEREEVDEEEEEESVAEMMETMTWATKKMPEARKWRRQIKRSYKFIYKCKSCAPKSGF